MKENLVCSSTRELEAKLKESLSDDAITKVKKEAEENAKQQLEVHTCV